MVSLIGGKDIIPRQTCLTRSIVCNRMVGDQGKSCYKMGFGKSEENIKVH